VAPNGIETLLARSHRHFGSAAGLAGDRLYLYGSGMDLRNLELE